MSRNKSRIAIALGIVFSAGTTLGLADDDMGNPNPQNELELHSATLTDPLSITIAPGNTIELPAGTVVGKQEIENAGAETQLANVMLIQDLTFTDPTGQTITLPAGTTIQKLEVEPNEFKLVAVDANGNVIQQINNEVGEDEHQAEDANRRGRDGQAANANRGPGDANEGRDEQRNVALTDPVTVIIDAAGDTIVLPAGTIVGKQEMKNGETELKNVTLVQDLTFNDPTGGTVTLAAGTRIQKIEVEPNEFKLHAVQPDGTVVQIRNEAGENEEAAEHAANASRGRDSAAAGATSERDRGRGEAAEVENDVEEQAEHAAADVNRGPGSANSDAGRPDRVSSARDHGSGDRGDRVERAVAAAMDRPAMDRPSSGDRPQHVDRVERSDHSGRH